MAVMARMREKRWRDECQLQEPKKVGSRCRGPSSSWHFKEKIPAHTTQWFKYIEEGLWSDAAHAQGKLFRRRFRVPWSFYKAIVKHVGEDENFSELMPGPDALGRPPTLLDLKVLGVLRVLGRYVTFDDIEELNGISAETNRKFFHDFVRLYSTHVYPIAVRWPDPDETRDILETARRAATDGLGIAPLLELTCKAELDRGELVEVLRGALPDTAPFWALTPTSRTRSAATTALLNHLTSTRR
jgi:hypothetical protein